VHQEFRVLRRCRGEEETLPGKSVHCC
jgi:hypothetical protein